MMKKILSLILAGVMLFCFAACGNTAAKKERKRATAGQDTTTSSKAENDQ